MRNRKKTKRTTFNPKSKELTPIYFCSQNNFININGNHPSIGEVIDIRWVVFEREDLKDDRWLFCINDINIIQDAKKYFDYAKGHNLVIIIQDLKEREKEDEEREGKTKDRNNKIREQWEHFVIQYKIDELNPRHIKSKYKDINSFENDYKNFKHRSKLPDEKEKINSGQWKQKKLPSILRSNYKEGDEIWVYNSFQDFLLYPGRSIECFLLIRNNQIICSPLISCTIFSTYRWVKS